MELQIVTTRGHGVAVIVRGLDTFNDALLECVPCHAPGPATPRPLSTAGIDEMERTVRSMASDEVDEVFAEGNTTSLALERGSVVASRIWHEPESDESLALLDFLDLLATWRQALIDAGGVDATVDGRVPAAMNTDPTRCRLCGCRLRGTEHIVRVGSELLHLSCAEPAMRDTPAWAHRELGPLDQLVAGLGRATVV